MTRPRGSRAERFYVILLFAYPSDFRREHGDESARTFARLDRDTPGFWARLRLWTTTVAQVLAHGLGERADRRRRHAGTGALLSGVWRDAATGARLWRKTPWHALVAIVSLALGVGVSVAVVNVLLAVFSWSAVPESSRLAAIGAATEAETRWSFTPAQAQPLFDSAGSFEGIAAERFGWAWLTEADRGVELEGGLVTFSYFDVLRLQPLQGRFFSTGDAARLSPHSVAVISHRLWNDHFGADPTTVGRTVRINGEPATILGVAPEGFRGLYQGLARDVWIPHDLSDRRGAGAATALYRAGGSFELVGRLAPGHTRETAAAEVTALLAAMPRDEASPPRALVEPLRGVHPNAREDLADTPSAAAGVAGVLLTLTCLNLAGLLSSRNAGRRREFAIRLALGGTRRQLILQLCAENLCVAATAAAVAILAAGIGQSLVARWFAYSFPGLRVHLDPWSVGIAALLATLVVIAFSLVPAILASRSAPAGLGERRESASAALSPSHRFLMTMQVALALMLVMGGAMMAQSVTAALSVGGRQADTILHYRVRPSRAAYSPAEAAAYFERLTTGLRQTAAVQTIALSRVGIDRGWCCAALMRPADRPGAPPIAVENNHVTASFFGMMEIPLLAGRSFSGTDRAGAPAVAIINQALAQRLWPGDSPVGRLLHVTGEDFAADVDHIVIGVAADVHPSRPGEAPLAFAYFPYEQLQAVDARLFVQFIGPEAAAARDVEAVIAGSAADVHVGQAGTLADRLRLAQAPQVALLGILRSSAVAALLLSAIGLHGLLLIAVGRRRREDAIRMALGALRHHVVRNVGMDVARVMVPGLLLGGFLAWFQGGLLKSYLLGTPPFDPALLALAVVALLVVGLVAGLLPARRASSLEPAAVLRE